MSVTCEDCGAVGAKLAESVEALGAVPVDPHVLCQDCVETFIRAQMKLEAETPSPFRPIGVDTKGRRIWWFRKAVSS